MKTRNFLIFLLSFLALGALGGGGLLIIDPSGELLGTPLSMLDTSPFNDFLIPGIILFIVFGVVPFMLIYALLKKSKSIVAERLNTFKDMHWSWSFTIYLGFALIIWIQLQIVFIDGVGWLHTFYTFLALIILFVTLLPKIRLHYLKKDIH